MPAARSEERIDALPGRWARDNPSGTAIVHPAGTTSWIALHSAIARCSELLSAAGAREGERVMIVAENSPPLIASLFATSTLGATAVIVNPRLSDRELDGIRAHAAPVCTVFATGIATEIDRHAERLGATPAHVDALGALALAPAASAASRDAPQTLGVAAIVYTSGTSGRPKGVMLTHDNLLFVARISARLRELRPTDRVFGALPIYHVYGLASVLLGTFCAGAALVTLPRFEARRALDLITSGRLTVFQAVPAMYARMLELDPGTAHRAAPALRYLYAGGSPLDATLKASVEARFGLPLHNGYGLTECSPTVSQTLLATPRTDCSVGPPIPGIEIRIVDTAGEDVVAGDVGELWVRGPNVMQGYYRDTEATAQAMRAEGWLATGDLARLANDGALFIVGRSKELIIRSGLNVYPGEVEAVLNAHPAVSQSVVVGRALADGNEEVIAYVELAPGAVATEATLVAHAVTQLTAYKRPARIHILDALPASATGKVLRGKLKALAQGATA